MFNSLLNLEFSSHTKVIASADDLAIMTKGNTPSEAEVFVNSDLAKIEKWAKENKMQFNETVNIVYDRIPLTVATELKEEGLTKWQRQWESTDKGALCRSFSRQ
jgi:hypothetical protein